MSYLLDALNKSGNNSTSNTNNPSSQTHSSQNQSSQNQSSQAMMYHQAAFDQDEGINVYKWVSIVLALVLTLLLGIVLGNKFLFQSNQTAPTAVVKLDPQVSSAPAQTTTPSPVAEPVVQAAAQTSTTPAEIEQAVTAAVSRAPMITQVIEQAAEADEQLVISGNRTQPNPVNSIEKDPDLNNISDDLLQKFNNAIEQSENPTVAQTAELEKQLKQNDERIEQYFSHIATIDELTPQMQADIPDLIYGTHIFSTDADQRWIKINEQTLQERQWLNDDIQVIEIQQQFVIFEMRHTRFSLLALTDWIGASPN